MLSFMTVAIPVILLCFEMEKTIEMSRHSRIDGLTVQYFNFTGENVSPHYIFQVGNYCRRDKNRYLPLNVSPIGFFSFVCFILNDVKSKTRWYKSAISPI